LTAERAVRVAVTGDSAPGARVRRRVLAILRKAFRVLGFKRRSIGRLGGGGAAISEVLAFFGHGGDHGSRATRSNGGGGASARRWATSLSWRPTSALSKAVLGSLVFSSSSLVLNIQNANAAVALTGAFLCTNANAQGRYFRNNLALTTYTTGPCTFGNSGFVPGTNTYALIGSSGVTANGTGGVFNNSTGQIQFFPGGTSTSALTLSGGTDVITSAAGVTISGVAAQALSPTSTYAV